MGNIGRFCCVALPFILTAAALVCLLITGLSDASGPIYLFKVNTTDLSINPASLKDQLIQAGSNTVNGVKGDITNSVGGATNIDISNIDTSNLNPEDITNALNGAGINTRRRRNVVPEVVPRADDDYAWHDKRFIDGTVSQPGIHKKATTSGSSSSGTGAVTGSNITASDIGLFDVYYVYLFGYCYEARAGNSRGCTPRKFDWATSALSQAAEGNFTSPKTGVSIRLPEQVRNSVKAFTYVAKWTQVAFIAAFIALGLELFFGAFATCSRAWSCVTYIIAGLATTLVIVAAGLATATAAVVVGVIQATDRFYGVTGGFNTYTLSLMWIAAALAIGASLFWLFTVCCCKPDRSRGRGADDDKMGMRSSAYQPLNEPDHMYGAGANGAAPSYYNSGPQYGSARQQGARSDVAYEPYSHQQTGYVSKV